MSKRDTVNKRFPMKRELGESTAQDARKADPLRASEGALTA